VQKRNYGTNMVRGDGKKKKKKKSQMSRSYLFFSLQPVFVLWINVLLWDEYGAGSRKQKKKKKKNLRCRVHTFSFLCNLSLSFGLMYSFSLLWKVDMGFGTNSSFNASLCFSISALTLSLFSSFMASTCSSV
jgi:hypothetical protein